MSRKNKDDGRGFEYNLYDKSIRPILREESALFICQVALSACKLGEALAGEPGNTTAAAKPYIKEEIALKSLLRNARCAVHLYILVAADADAEAVRGWLQRARSPWQPVTYSFVTIDDGAVRERLAAIHGPLQVPPPVADINPKHVHHLLTTSLHRAGYSGLCSDHFQIK